MVVSAVALGAIFSSFLIDFKFPFNLYKNTAAVVLTRFTRSPTERNVVVPGCTDTDYGIYYSKKGTVTLTLDGGQKEYATDICINNMVVRENWCAQNSYGKSFIQASDITCKFGCMNSECGIRSPNIEGRVVDVSNNSVVGATIFIVGKGEYYDRTISDSSGNFSLQDLTNLSISQRQSIARDQVSLFAVKIIGNALYESEGKLMNISLSSINNTGTLVLRPVNISDSKYFSGVNLEFIKSITSVKKPVNW